MKIAIYLPLAVLFLAMLALLLWQKRRIAQLRAQIAFREIVEGRVGMLTVTYDVRRDEARLSRDAAKLFGLPDTIQGLSKREKDAMFEGGATLSPVSRCLAAIQKDEAWTYVRRGAPPRRFVLRSYVFEEADGRAALVIGTFRDVTAQANEEARLAARAQFDGLTRVHNSSATRAWMKENIGRRPGVLFLLDIDKFKSVNDTIGHQGGDLALVCVANGLRQAFGGRGFLGRLGGDEFTCYLDGADRTEAATIAENIHAAVTQLAENAGLAIPITVSIGVALLTIEDDEAAYKKADRALYQAKEQGRNRHVIVE